MENIKDSLDGLKKELAEMRERAQVLQASVADLNQWIENLGREIKGLEKQTKTESG